MKSSTRCCCRCCAAITDCKSRFPNCHTLTPHCEEKRLHIDLMAIREAIESDDWKDLVWRATEPNLLDSCLSGILSLGLVYAIQRTG